ncbi:MAG TPA: class I SAM-dependent methyltransferase [Acidimicrobiales bacterium]|nr:class I SAM-dependent methyltransferase [Acidimicrobiales bacterium]
MTDMLHLDRRRAESFGDDPHRYDRARPTYPAAVVDDLLAGGARRVLDVGCGTGRAARLFADRGADVLGVEPDPRMAAVARSHGIAVEDGVFEGWDPAGRTFDLVVSAQAWHWVDPVAGPAKAASVLTPGGPIGLFWNLAVLPPDLKAAMDAVYRRLAPGLDRYSAVLGNAGPDRYEAAADALSASGSFDHVAVRRYGHHRPYTTDAWCDHLLTHSDHAGLDPGRRRVLLAAIGDQIDRAGGRFVVRYDTWLVTGNESSAGGTSRTTSASRGRNSR